MHAAHKSRMQFSRMCGALLQQGGLQLRPQHLCQLNWFEREERMTFCCEPLVETLRVSYSTISHLRCDIEVLQYRGIGMTRVVQLFLGFQCCVV
jgi:hypothetical protein